MRSAAHSFFAKAAPVAAVMSLLATSVTAQQLTAEQIHEGLSGKCIAYWGPTEGTECYHANGDIHYSDQSVGDGAGEWVISGTRLCTTYDTTPDAKCTVIRKTGDNEYTDGSYSWRVTNETP
jgi:hypothetical protein